MPYQAKRSLGTKRDLQKEAKEKQMSVLGQYVVSTAFPSVIGGVGNAFKYFGNTPTASNWNSSIAGVNQRVDSSQIGGTPSATNAQGQLMIDTTALRFGGGRFRIYASGSAVSGVTPQFQPQVQINTGTVASPSYASLLAPLFSPAFTANKPVSWSVAGDLFFDLINGNIGGFSKYTYNAVAGGTPVQTTQPEQGITPVTGVLTSNQFTGAAITFGFVVGGTFSTSDASNSASLYEFKIVQD
jgi:hypothetical protein